MASRKRLLSVRDVRVLSSETFSRAIVDESQDVDDLSIHRSSEFETISDMEMSEPRSKRSRNRGAGSNAISIIDVDRFDVPLPHRPFASKPPPYRG